jgi:hemerythrin-like domain-containing protein
MSLKQFLSVASQFTSHLSTHHAIEEQHIFPVLARKMPQFRNTALLLEQHKKIHEGMDVFEKYIDEVRSGERELELKELAKRMEWGGVLWAHLEEEVKTLGAENMRQYWTVEEMRRMPM